MPQTAASPATACHQYNIPASVLLRNSTGRVVACMLCIHTTSDRTCGYTEEINGSSKGCETKLSYWGTRQALFGASNVYSASEPQVFVMVHGGCLQKQSCNKTFPKTLDETGLRCQIWKSYNLTARTQWC